MSFTIRGGLKSKILALFLIISFLNSLVFPLTVQANPIWQLPAPTEMISISTHYSYPVIRGLKINPQNPLDIEFIIDSGDKDNVSKDEIDKLIQYFLAGLTMPEENLWVNLSPYEKERVMTDKLARTELGVQLLGQDYILKQLFSSLTYPESRLGKLYWNKVYKEVAKEFGHTNFPINTFNKVWIMPSDTQVYEKDNTVVITSTSLKTLLEEDFLALSRNTQMITDLNTQPRKYRDKISTENQIEKINKVVSKVIKEIIVPKINDDVNVGQNFAPLRQVYYSLILATWFKRKFRESFYKNYIDKQRIKGIDNAGKDVKENVYNLYREAFEKGVYNLIKKDVDPGTKRKIKRNYYSGGVQIVMPQFTAHSNLQKIPLFSEIRAKVTFKPISSSPLKLVHSRENIKSQKGAQILRDFAKEYGDMFVPIREFRRLTGLDEKEVFKAIVSAGLDGDIGIELDESNDRVRVFEKKSSSSISDSNSELLSLFRQAQANIYYAEFEQIDDYLKRFRDILDSSELTGEKIDFDFDYELFQKQQSFVVEADDYDPDMTVYRYSGFDIQEMFKYVESKLTVLTYDNLSAIEGQKTIELIDVWKKAKQYAYSVIFEQFFRLRENRTVPIDQFVKTSMIPIKDIADTILFINENSDRFFVVVDSENKTFTAVERNGVHTDYDKVFLENIKNNLIKITSGQLRANSSSTPLRRGNDFYQTIKKFENTDSNGHLEVALSDDVAFGLRTLILSKNGKPYKSETLFSFDIYDGVLGFNVEKNGDGKWVYNGSNNGDGRNDMPKINISYDKEKRKLEFTFDQNHKYNRYEEEKFEIAALKKTSSAVKNILVVGHPLNLAIAELQELMGRGYRLHYAEDYSYGTISKQVRDGNFDGVYIESDASANRLVNLINQIRKDNADIDVILETENTAGISKSDLKSMNNVTLFDKDEINGFDSVRAGYMKDVFGKLLDKTAVKDMASSAVKRDTTYGGVSLKNIDFETSSDSSRFYFEKVVNSEDFQGLSFTIQEIKKDDIVLDLISL